MAAKNFGTGVSRTLDATGRAWLHVILNQGRPALEYELNLMQDVGLARMADDQRRLFPSGFLSLPDFGFVDSEDFPNAFLLPSADADALVARVNGWTLPVRGTAVSDLSGGVLNNIANLVSLPAPPTSGARTDLVYLEVWLALVTGNSDAQPIKPPSRSRLGQSGQVVQKSQVWPFGNILYGGETLDDDIVDPDVGLETTKRVQLQYALRVWPGIDLASYPRGLGAPDVVGIGPQESLIVFGSAFRNIGGETGDYGVWISDTPNLTVDGRVYAVPVCAVHRRNSAGFSEVSNPNGSSPAVDGDLALRPDGFAADRVVPPDITDLRHRAEVYPPLVAGATADRVLSGALATSFGSDPVSVDVSGSSVSVQKKVVTAADLSPARSDHAGFCDGLRRVFGADPSVEKNVFMAISNTTSPDPSFPGAWGTGTSENTINTITLVLPASSDARFSGRSPRAILSVTQEEITIDSVALGPNGKSLTLTFGVGSYYDDDLLNGRQYQQDVWLYFDVEVPPSPGLRAEPRAMQAPHARSMATDNLDPGTGRRVANALPSTVNNDTFYGTLYKGMDSRLPASARRLPAPLIDATTVEVPTAYFGGMLDLDSYLAGADPKPLANSALTLDLLASRLDSLVDMDNDLNNIDAGWVDGRRAMFIRPLNATAVGDGSSIGLTMSTHALYVIRDISLPGGVALFTVISPVPIVHLRGVYLRKPGTTGHWQTGHAAYTKGDWRDWYGAGGDPDRLGEVAGRLVEDEVCLASGIVDRGAGANTYRLTEQGVLLSRPIMQVLRIDKKDPSNGVWIRGGAYEAGILRKGGGREEMIVPVYVREGGATTQVAFVKRTELSGGAVRHEVFEFSADVSAADYAGNYRITYRVLADITSVPLDTDILIGESDYVLDKVSDPGFPADSLSPGKPAFTAAGLRNGYEAFLDADIRVALPIDAVLDAPVEYVPAQAATLETDELVVVDVPGEMLLTTASAARLGNATLPSYAGGATSHAPVSEAPPGADFLGGPISVFGSEEAALVRVQAVSSAGRDPVGSLHGQRVRLRPTAAGVFDALLGLDGEPIRVVAEAPLASAAGDIAAFLPVTAVAATGEVLLLLLSQRNLAERDTGSPGYGLFSGRPVVDTGADGFACAVYRPLGRPLVRAGADGGSA